MKIKRINKRGLSHIEAILSFVIFIGFLIFAFFFFSPFRGGDVLDTSIDYAFDEIRDYAKVELESYSIVIENSVPDLVSFSLVPTIDNFNVRVEDSDGLELTSGYSSGSVNLNRQGNNFFVVKFSEAFSAGSLGSGTILAEEDFSVSSSEKIEIFSESRVLELANEYENNYIELKTSFNLPNRIDFAFSLEFDDGSLISGEIDIPQGLEVISQQERVEIIRENGEIVFANFFVRVW